MGFFKIIKNKIIWIHFENPRIGNNTRLKIYHLNNKFPRLNKSWTPIE